MIKTPKTHLVLKTYLNTTESQPTIVYLPMRG